MQILPVDKTKSLDRKILINEEIKYIYDGNHIRIKLI